MKRLLLLALFAGCAWGQIKTVLVPASAMSTCGGGSGSIYQVWIQGADSDTVAFLVSISYRVNDNTLTAQSVALAGTAGGAPYLNYDGVALIAIPSQSPDIMTVTVSQLAATSSQVYAETRHEIN
jgi:hypothetical protein